MTASGVSPGRWCRAEHGVRGGYP